MLCISSTSKKNQWTQNTVLLFSDPTTFPDSRLSKHAAQGSNFGLEISLVTGRWTSFTLPYELKIKKKKKEAWEPTLIPPKPLTRKGTEGCAKGKEGKQGADSVQWRGRGAICCPIIIADLQVNEYSYIRRLLCKREGERGAQGSRRKKRNCRNMFSQRQRPKAGLQGKSITFKQAGIKEGEEEGTAREEGRATRARGCNRKAPATFENTVAPFSSFLSTEAARRVTAESRPVTGRAPACQPHSALWGSAKAPRVPTPAAGCGCCCCSCRRRRPQ